MKARLAAAVVALLAGGACTSMPTPKMTRHSFPEKGAYVEEVKRPHTRLGLVRTKVNFVSLDWVHEEDQLCRNYYNKAVADLVRRAKDLGGDAVVEVRSVVFLETGQTETYKTPECSDDGQEGQILAQGFAVKWLPEKPQKKTD